MVEALKSVEQIYRKIEISGNIKKILDIFLRWYIINRKPIGG